ncbi:MAG: 6,7-dimethyl-8-ribityllumazine synthase [Rhodospirillales bacterium]|nr:6,7-dimethyl-8-ribityllumazine synthase [Rhodospirillales bacterium]
MATTPHILILEARYYQDITDNLARGAITELEAWGATYERVELAGAFEIPGGMRMAIATGKYDGYLALGCVLRGETSHYGHICNEVARGINDLAMKHMAPVGFGVLTCDTLEQAEVRADPERKNKGKEAAVACIKMVELAATLRVTG